MIDQSLGSYSSMIEPSQGSCMIARSIESYDDMTDDHKEVIVTRLQDH